MAKESALSIANFLEGFPEATKALCLRDFGSDGDFGVSLRVLDYRRTSMLIWTIGLLYQTYCQDFLSQLSSPTEESEELNYCRLRQELRCDDLPPYLSQIHDKIRFVCALGKAIGARWYEFHPRAKKSTKLPERQEFQSGGNAKRSRYQPTLPPLFVASGTKRNGRSRRKSP